MKNIQRIYLLLIALLSVLWLLADTVLSDPYDFFSLRTSLMNYTGIIGIGVMSIGMLLAIQQAIAENLLGGLDKSYRLHKWLAPPFIARMEALAEKADAREIDMFYSTATPDEGFIAKMQASADKAGVHLHVLRSDADGRLSANQIYTALPA